MHAVSINQIADILHFNDNKQQIKSARKKHGKNTAAE